MAAELDYQMGKRQFRAKSFLVTAIKLDSDMVIQVGTGIVKATRGSYVITMPGGQQWPLDNKNFDGFFEGVE